MRNFLFIFLALFLFADFAIAQNRGDSFPGRKIAITVSPNISGLVPGNVVKKNPTLGQYTNAVAGLDQVGGIVESADVSKYTVVISGEITGLSGLIEGTSYQVSTTTPGLLAPRTGGAVCLIATSATTGWVIQSDSINGRPHYKSVDTPTDLSNITPAIRNVNSPTNTDVGLVVQLQTGANRGQQYQWEQLGTGGNFTAVDRIPPTTVTATASSTILTATSHGYAVGNTVHFRTTIGLPAPLALNTVYYVESVPSSSTFTVAATSGGAAISMLGTGTGTHTVSPTGYWVRIDRPVLEGYLGNSYYKTGDIIRQGSGPALTLYRTSSGTANVSFNATEALQWTYVSQDVIPSWFTGVTYITRQRVTFLDGIWESQSTRVSGASFDATERANWTRVGSFSATVSRLDAAGTPNSTTTLSDVGLSCQFTAGIGHFRAFIPYTSAATTTGSRWTVTFSSAPTTLAYTSQYTLSATTATINYLSAQSLPAAANASSLATGNIAVIEGHVTPGAPTTMNVQFASEVAASAITPLAGAWLECKRVQ
jgi:hypothetical protein